MTALGSLGPTTAPKAGLGELAAGRRALRLFVSVSLHQYMLGIGFAILAGISATSIALDVKSRTDAAWVRHTLETLNELSDARLSFRRAESAARGYLLTDDQYFLDEYRGALGQVTPAFAALKETVKDNPAQRQLLETSEEVVARRFAFTSEAVRLEAAGDHAGIAALTAKAEGRTLMETIDTAFERLAGEEQRLLEVRTLTSEGTGSLLLAVDLGCAAVIFLLATMLTRSALRARQEQDDRRRVSETANERLEAAIAERTEHLIAAHGKIRHSAAVLSSTFASMAEAVLVVDNDGKIVLANVAAERLLQYRPGMTFAQLRAQSLIYEADGSTQLATDETLIKRVLRGEQLDGIEIVMHTGGGHDRVEFVVSGRALRDAPDVVSGGALVFRDVTAARETERKLGRSQRLDAIGRLTGGVAHDFNNMLTVISGSTEILVEELHDQPDLRGVAALLNQAADRCTELIRRLLAFVHQ